MRWFSLLFLLFNSSVVFAAKTMVWLTDNDHDLLSLNTNTRQTLAIDTINLVLKELKSYEVIFKVTSVSRMEFELKNNQNICVINRVKNEERTEYSEFTRPVSMHPTPILYYAKGNVVIPPQTLTGAGRLVSLKLLLELNPTKKIALLKDASYGADVDGEIAQLNPELITYFNVDNRYQMVAMLLLDGLVDFIIDNPLEFSRKVKELGKSDAIGSLSFSSGQPFVLGHIACSKSDQGRAAVIAINEGLDTICASDAFHDAHFDYIDENAKVIFEPIFTNLFLSRQ